MDNLVDFYQSFGGNIDDALVDGDAKPQEVEFDLPTRTQPVKTSPQATQSSVTPQVAQTPNVHISQTKCAQKATQPVSTPTPSKTQPVRTQFVGIPTEQLIVQQKQRMAQQAQQLQEQITEQPIQQNTQTPVQTSVPQNVVESTPDTQHVDKTPQELMELTDTFYPDIWMKKYEQALKSKKRNHIRDKMVRGRFRIDKNQVVEILPEINTSKLSFEDMLEMKWIPDNSVKSI